MKTESFWSFYFKLILGIVAGIGICCFIGLSIGNFITLDIHELDETNHEVIYSDWLQIAEVLPSTTDEGFYDVRLEGKDIAVLISTISSETHLQQNGYFKASVIQYTGNQKHLHGYYLLKNDFLKSVEILTE